MFTKHSKTNRVAGLAVGEWANDIKELRYNKILNISIK